MLSSSNLAPVGTQEKSLPPSKLLVVMPVLCWLESVRLAFFSLTLESTDSTAVLRDIGSILLDKVIQDPVVEIIVHPFLKKADRGILGMYIELSGISLAIPRSQPVAIVSQAQTAAYKPNQCRQQAHYHLAFHGGLVLHQKYHVLRTSSFFFFSAHSLGGNLGVVTHSTTCLLNKPSSSSLASGQA